jgi:hypothetical protein
LSLKIRAVSRWDGLTGEDSPSLSHPRFHIQIHIQHSMMYSKPSFVDIFVSPYIGGSSRRSGTIKGSRRKSKSSTGSSRRSASAFKNEQQTSDRRPLRSFESTSQPEYENKTYQLALIHHGRDDELRPSYTLVKRIPMQLCPISPCHSCYSCSCIAIPVPGGGRPGGSILGFYDGGHLPQSSFQVGREDPPEDGFERQG